MTKLLLSLHVLAAILAIGPITVAASMFPRYLRESAPGGAEAGGADPGGRAAEIAAFLHRTCRGYAVVGIAVPVFGFATGAALGVLTDAWLIVSIVLTAIAAGVLVTAILPGQKQLLALGADEAAHAGARSQVARLTALTGTFNLLWTAVVILMIVRPGSTTGA